MKNVSNTMNGTTSTGNTSTTNQPSGDVLNWTKDQQMQLQNAIKQFNNYKIIDFLKAKNLSKEIIKKIKFGGVLLNENLVTDINKSVNYLDKVKIVLPKDDINKFAKKINGELKVLYEDDYLVAVFKDSGILTHSSRYNENESIEQLFYGKYQSDGFAFRPINRLDKDTSGILLIAKDMLTASFMGNIIKSREVEKIYQTIVVGQPSENHFIIEKPIIVIKILFIFKLIDAQTYEFYLANSSITIVRLLANNLTANANKMTPKNLRKIKIISFPSHLSILPTKRITIYASTRFKIKPNIILTTE